MRRFLLFIIAVFGFSLVSFGQDFTNKGKDFWVGYGYHQVMVGGNAQDMVLYFATDQITTITVSIPGLGYTATYPNIAANTVFTTPPMPKAGVNDARLLADGISNKGIHVVATKPIVSYAHIYNASVSGACVMLPTNTLGKEYYSINYKNVSNSANANSWFYVVATEPGTTAIEITPSAATLNSVWTAGNTYTVNLTQGQIYNVMGALLPNTGTAMSPVYNAVDLTGSKIKSISTGSEGCKKIAVYSGSGRISITCPNTTSSSSDNYMVQAFPKTAWGRKFLTATTGIATTAPVNAGMTYNIYRICVSSPAAVVKINNVVITLPLQNGFYYEVPATNVPLKIESDSTITVAQYVTSQNTCGNNPNPGDPEVIYLSPVEQNIKKVLFNSNLLVAAGPKHYVNAIIPNGGTALSSFRIDGAVPSVPFTVHPQDPNFSFIKIPNLTLGAHTLVSDSGFNAIAYGFASAESYGYNAGTNVLDLIQSNTLVTQYGSGGSPTACTGAPFKFRISLGFKPLKLTWNLNVIPGMLPNNTNVVQNPNPACTLLSPLDAALYVCPDSITIVNGKEKFWYSLPTFYTINTIGTYPINIDVVTSNTDGCGTNQDIDFDLEVSAPPVANFTYNQPNCYAETIQFNDASNTTLNYKWYWSFGEPSTGNADTSYSQNPTHTYSGPGTYNVRFASITTAGCLSDTITKQVIVPAFPTGTISGTTSLCINAPAPTITFTGAQGTKPYEFTYNINGGTSQTIQTIGTSNTITINPPTNIAGTFIYNLTNIKSVSSTLCTTPILNQSATIVINTQPTALITGSNTVCQGAAAQLITFTGAVGTAPYTFTYTFNNGPNQTITTTTGNSVTISVPTTTIGSFSYDLVSVSDGSASICSGPATGNATVVVQATSTAIIAGTVAVCQDATAPIITFTAANGTAPFTFSYNINGGTTQTITTVAPSATATITVPMTTAGTFTYNLLSVQNTGPTTCISPITGQSAIVTINPNPTATISGTNTVCQAVGTQNITFTGAGGTAPYTFTYNINGGASQTVTTASGNSVTVPISTNIIGVFTYTLTQVKDASAGTQCTRAYTTGNAAVFEVQATSTATISGTTSVCNDATAPIITFTGANGNAPFTFTFNINGGATQSIMTSATSNSATISVPMASAGTFTYNLLSVKNTGPILCLTPITGASAVITIRPLPTATITGTASVCQNSTAPTITFTGGNATAPYTFTYTINGGAAQTITTISGNSITLPAPTGTFGNYVYAITKVSEFTGCVKNITATTATITVNQVATATLTGSTTVCQDDAVPFITFTATGGVPPYTFYYTLNGVGGDNTTLSGNSFLLGSSTTVPTTFNYVLLSVKESSSTTCLNNQTGNATVIVNPKPTASYAVAAPYCAQNAVTITPTFGITPTGSVTSWVWNYGDGTGTQIRPNGLPFNVTYATPGIKPVSFKVISDKGCASNLATTPVVLINGKPKAGFINPEACLADAFAQFTDTSSVTPGGPASIVFWEWDFGDGTPVLSGSTPAIKNPLHAFATVGNKTVRLIVTTNSGCKDTVTQMFFINGEVTTADFLPQGGFCSNRPVVIKENSVVNVGGLIRVDIHWDNIAAPTVVEVDDLPTVGKLYYHSYPNLQVDRTYTVRYIAYSGFNGVCQKETTKTILVRASPVASFAPPINVCLNGGPVQLAGTETGGVGGTSVYMGTGVSATGLFNPLTAGAGTNNNITFTAISPNSCDSALVRPIHVLIPPVANFATVGNLCVGPTNVVTFHQTSTVTAGEGGAIVKWIYDWGDGTPVQTFTTGADVTHAYSTAGPKTARLIVEDAFGCRNAAPGTALNFTVNPLPVPSYSLAAPTVCLPNANITFTNTTANVGNNTYNWSFELPSTAVANVSTLTSPTHLYGSQGPFSTQLVATNIISGCKDSTAILVINSTTIKPEPVVDFAPIADICLNNGVRQLTEGSETSGIAGGPGVYSGPGVSASGVFNPLVAGVGTHTLIYTFTSSFGCSKSIPGTIKVLSPPVVNIFTTVGNVCETNGTVFTNTTNATVGVVAQWIYNWGGGTPTQTMTTGADVTHTYAVAGNYVPTLTLVTDYGCNSAPAFTLNLTVNPLPKPNFTFSDTACLPAASVLFKNTTPSIAGNTFLYNWNFDVPSTAASDMSTSATTVPHLYYTQAPHTASLTVSSIETGCTDTKTKVINTIHPAPFANFDFNKVSACLGKDVCVIDKSTFADGTANGWLWDWNDGSTSMIQNACHFYAAPSDNYLVKLRVTNSFGCIDDTTMQFAVYELPTANAGRDSVILLGGNIVLTPTVTGRNLTYLWSGIPAPENLSSNIVKNPTASPVEDITYKLLVTGIGGCPAPADFVFIKVLKDPVVPNTFTPNNDGNHDTWVIKYLESYPDNRVQVFTRTGQLVFESRKYLKPWDGTYNGKSLPIDTYYYILEPGSGRKPITGFVTIIK